MAAVPFDTLRFARKLEKSGFTRDQADGAAEALAETMGETVATKTDLRELEMRLTATLTARFGMMLAAAVGILVAVDKLI